MQRDQNRNTGKMPFQLTLCNSCKERTTPRPPTALFDQSGGRGLELLLGPDAPQRTNEQHEQHEHYQRAGKPHIIQHVQHHGINRRAPEPDPPFGALSLGRALQSGKRFSLRTRTGEGRAACNTLALAASFRRADAGEATCVFPLTPSGTERAGTTIALADFTPRDTRASFRSGRDTTAGLATR